MKPLFADAAVLRIIDSVAIVLAQAYQLVRMRLSSCPSPVLLKRPSSLLLKKRPSMMSIIGPNKTSILA